MPTTDLTAPAARPAPGEDPGAPGDGGAPGDERLGSLWARFRDARDEASRSALVTAYYPLVKHVARRVASGLSCHVELGDLEGWGAVGLLDAVDRYDASRGAQFATFAVHRIRGAMYDGIRQVDWAPRSLRRREREIQSNFAQLCNEHGREPTESEEAGALGVAVDILRSAKGQISSAHVASLEGRSQEGRAREGRHVAEPSDPDEEPLAACIARETSLALQAMLRSLDERERTVTALSFAEGLTLAEIGARLGVTESRVCQIRATAIKRLRAYARAQGLVPA